MIGRDELRAIIRETRSTHDVYLAALESAAVDHLERETGHYFGDPKAVTLTLVGDGTPVLWLRDLIHGASAPATVDQRSSPAASATTITASASDGYVVRGDSISKLVRKAGLVWLLGYEYEVTFDRGYDAPPPSARQFVSFCVAHWFERRVPLPKVGETLTADVPHHASALLGGLRGQRV
jgi:hypothetical protein